VAQTDVMTMRTVGVEEELLLVSPGTPHARPVAEEVVAVASQAADCPEFEHEFKREQVEIATRPCSSLDELTGELRRLRTEVADAACALGTRVVALATSPLPGRPTPTPDERYEDMARAFGLVARQQLTCGQHVHVSVASKEEGVAVLDRLRPWLAILAALSANSPFWQGEDTGYASYRSIVWGQWPTAGPTERFGDVAGYERAVTELLESGTTLDRGMIYFDARLSESYPTVEIRVADVCQDVQDAIAVAGLCRALVATAAEQWRAGIAAPDVRVELLRAAAWRAARSGLGADLVDVRRGRPRPAWTLVDELLANLGPAMRGTGDEDIVLSALKEIRERGNGAMLQQAAYARRNALADVITAAVERTAGCRIQPRRRARASGVASVSPESRDC
jgi:glutamate---cysteine ligase / carboxylate-amine ligase